MSERKGGSHASKRSSVKISGKMGDVLIKRTQVTKLSKKQIVEYLIDLDSRFELTSPGWENRINEALDLADAERDRVERQKYKALDTACPALEYVDTKWVCIWGRQKKTPQSKILSANLEGAQAICSACGKTLKLIQNYEGQIEGLKAKVESGMIVDIASCVQGGRISDDGKRIYCNRTTEWMKVSDCKTLRKGANCKDLRWTRIDMKGKFAEKDSR